jgi:hypothetical protein
MAGQCRNQPNSAAKMLERKGAAVHKAEPQTMLLVYKACHILPFKYVKTRKTFLIMQIFFSFRLFFNISFLNWQAGTDEGPTLR